MSTSPSSVTSTAADISTESITGKLSNINDWYYVVSKSKVLGTGHFGSVRQCTDRITGERYAVKSISKNNPGLKWGVIAREIILLQGMKHDNIVRLEMSLKIPNMSIWLLIFTLEVNSMTKSLPDHQLVIVQYHALMKPRQHRSYTNFSMRYPTYIRMVLCIEILSLRIFYSKLPMQIRQSN